MDGPIANPALGVRGPLASWPDGTVGRAEPELLDQTLRGAIGLLTEVLGLVSASAYSRTQRIETIVAHLSAAVGRPEPWDLMLAAKLSQLGFVVLHDSTEVGLVQHQVHLAAELVANIPRMETVAHAISHQLDDGPVGGPTDWHRWEAGDVNAELLRVAVRFDELTASGASLERAYQVIAAGPTPPPRLLLDALAGLKIDWHSLVEARVLIRDLTPGMHLAGDVAATSGLLLASTGTVLTSTLIGRIRSFAHRVGVVEPITVLVPESAMAKLDSAP